MSGRRSPCPPREIAALLAKQLPDTATVLDIACGNGEALAALAQANPAWTLWGLDLDAASLQQAAQACPTAALTQGRAEALPYPAACCDGVLLECIFSLLEEETLADISRVCRKGGLLLLNDLHSQDSRDYLVKGDGSILWLRSREKLAALPLSLGWSLLQYQDKTHALGDFVAQLLMEGRACDCLDAAAITALRHFHPGYGLWLWQKE